MFPTTRNLQTFGCSVPMIASQASFVEVGDKFPDFVDLLFFLA
jgi:hypothetical protein